MLMRDIITIFEHMPEGKTIEDDPIQLEWKLFYLFTIDAEYTSSDSQGKNLDDRC